MKYRAGFNKIKQEHSMIKGLKDFLLLFASHAEITAMIPGPITPVKRASAKVIVRRLTPTHTGYRALIQSGAAIQEVFFVGDIEHITSMLAPYMRDA